MNVRYLLVAGAGMFVGYYVAKGRLESRFQDDLARETEEAREFYRQRYEKATAEKVRDPKVVEAAQALENYRVGLEQSSPKVMGEMADAVKELEEVVATLEKFAVSEDEQEVPSTEDFEPKKVVPVPPIPKPAKKQPAKKIEPVRYDQVKKPESETPHKDSTPRPYEISQKDFVGNDSGYQQYSFTYYTGEMVLLNESDEVLSSAIGEKSLGKDIFHDLKEGGLEPMYVRNDTEKWEFEVTRIAGDRSADMLGEQS